MANEDFRHAATSSDSGADAPNAVTLCAGFPYAGDRELTSQEAIALRREARIATSLGCLIPIAVPIIAIAIGVALEPLFTMMSKNVSDYFLVVVVVSSIVGCAIAMLWGMEFLERARKLRATRRHGFLRVFHGPYNWYDPTDPALLDLLKSRLLRDDAPAMANIELFPHLNELYAINGTPVKTIVKLTLTTGAARPTESMVLDIPKAWIENESDFQLERRRPSADELQELGQYAMLTRVYWLRTIGSGFCVALFLVYLLGLIVKMAVRASFIEPFEPGELLRVALLAPAAGAILTAYRVRRDLRFTRLIRQDMECNWIFMISPPKSEDIKEDIGNMVERLPVSNVLWTIGGKPAGWRRYFPRQG